MNWCAGLVSSELREQAIGVDGLEKRRYSRVIEGEYGGRTAEERKRAREEGESQAWQILTNPSDLPTPSACMKVFFDDACIPSVLLHDSMDERLLRAILSVYHLVWPCGCLRLGPVPPAGEVVESPKYHYCTKYTVLYSIHLIPYSLVHLQCLNIFYQPVNPSLSIESIHHH